MARKIFLTARPHKTYTSKEEILHDWHDGKDFRVYGGTLVSKNRTVEMLIRGITHVEVVYQDPKQDMKAVSVMIQLEGMRNG